LPDEALTNAVILYLGNEAAKGSHLFIQTLHPLTVAITDGYQSGWTKGRWNGVPAGYVLPYQWYFRTLHDWIALFVKAGFTIREIREPLHYATGKPASVIFIARK